MSIEHERQQPSRDIHVRNVTSLMNLDPLPYDWGFLSTDRSAGRRALISVSLTGTALMLWAPTNVEVSSAIAAPDGKHIAIAANTIRRNAWLISGL